MSNEAEDGVAERMV